MRACLLLSLVLSWSALRAEGLRPDEMADLAAESLTLAPEYPLPGERTRLTLTIRNRANETAASVDVAFFADGERIARRSITVPANGVARVVVPWRTRTGSVQVVSALVDPRRRLTELDHDDNGITRELAVLPRPSSRAALAVVSLETVDGILRVVIRNEGAASASAPLVLRRNGAVVRVVPAGPVAPYGTATVEIPWSDADGGQLSAQINPRFAKQTSLMPPGIALPGDLRIADLGLYASYAQRDVTIAFRVVNAGTTSITQSFCTRIESDGLPLLIETAGLAAGSAVHVSHTLESAPERFTVTATTDVDDVVAETNESNNRATLPFRSPAPDIDRWVSLGPRRVTGWLAHDYSWNDSVGRLSAVAIHPQDPKTIYVGAKASGVWKTTDGGATWRPLAVTAPMRVAALALAPNNPSRVYLLTMNNGLFASDDAGTTWRQLSAADLDAVIAAPLLVNPGNPRELLAASNDGVLRSGDGGATWRFTRSHAAAAAHRTGRDRA